MFDDLIYDTNKAEKIANEINSYWITIKNIKKLNTSDLNIIFAAVKIYLGESIKKGYITEWQVDVNNGTFHIK